MNLNSTLLATAAALLLPSLSLAQVSQQWSSVLADPNAPGSPSGVYALVRADDGGIVSLSLAGTLPTSQGRVRKHSERGQLEWDTVPGPAHFQIRGLVSDGAGGFYVAGAEEVSGYWNPDAVLAARLDANGQVTATHVWPDASFYVSFDDMAVAVAEGDLWIVGSLESGQSAFVRRIAPDGTLVAAAQWPMAPGTFVRAAVALPDGGLAFAGERSGRLFVANVDAAANLRWIDELVPPASPYSSRYFAMTVDPRSGRIAACGTLFSYGVQQQGLIRILESSGTVVRSEFLWAALPQRTRLDSVVVTSDSRFVFGGQREPTPNANYEGLILADDASGLRLFVGHAASLPGFTTNLSYLSAGEAGQVCSLQSLSSGSTQNRAIFEEWDHAGQRQSSLLVFAPNSNRTFRRFLRTPSGFALAGSASNGVTPVAAVVTYLGARQLPDAVCTGQTSVAGCEPQLVYEGRSSASGLGEFRVVALQLPSECRAVLFYGTQGTTAVPLGGGTRCVASPLARTGMGSTGAAGAGTLDCRGELSVDLNARVGLDPALTVPGVVVWAQAWARDPWAAGGGTVLSNALRFTVQP